MLAVENWLGAAMMMMMMILYSNGLCTITSVKILKTTLVCPNYRMVMNITRRIAE